MLEQVKKSLVLSIYFALAVSALLVFWQVRNFNFINYDDDLYVYENQHVTGGLTFDNIKWAFVTGDAANWHPVTWLSLMLDCQLFGPDAGRMHLVNLFLHIVNILLLFAVLRKMTGSLWPSAFVAAAFALHPMHVESVAWIAERKDMLSTLFWMLTLLAYVSYVKRPSIFRYLITLVLFAIGLLAKPMLVTLPFVLLLLDYWPLNRIKNFNRQIIYRLILEKIPFLALSVVSAVLTFLVQRSGGTVANIDIISLNDRIANAFLSYIEYIGKMFWPHNLAVFYPLKAAASFSFWQVAVCALLLIVISIFVIRFGRNQRYLPVGWFWFVGTLIPVIGIIQVGGQAYADRYTYIPYIGLFIMITWSISSFLSKRKIILGVLMVLVLAALAICANKQASYWKNSVTLFSHALAVTQNNYIAYNNIGVAYADLGRFSEAVDAHTQTVKIRPNYAEAFHNLGNDYDGLGRSAEAMDAYQQAIKIDPNYAEAHLNLGVALDKLNRTSEAIDAYQRAIKIRPDYAKAYFNLGCDYDKLRRTSDAIDAFQQAVKIKPDYAKAYNNLGNVYSKLSRFADAIDAYQEAVKSKPDFADAFYNLGIACASLGRYPQAVNNFKQVIKIRPDYVQAYNNLGAAYANLGRSSEAIESYKQAVKIKPDYAAAHENLAYAYLATGDRNSALAEYNILKSLNAQSANDLLKEINK